MAISNIWTNDKYQKRIEKLLEGKNTFELAAFFEKHEFADIDEQTEENTQDHDITVVDDLSFEVFEEHLGCYFSD